MTGVPPDHADENCTDLDVLMQSRQQWYAEAGEARAFDQVPNPAYAVPGQTGGRQRPSNDGPAFGCMVVVVAMIGAMSVAINFWRDGRALLGWLMLGVALLVALAVVKLLSFMGSRFIEATMARRVGRPWADFAAAADTENRDHFDMSWSVFAAHEAEMRSSVSALVGDRLSVTERTRLQSRVDVFGAEAFALRAQAERVSRALDEQTGDTVVRRRLVDTLPAFDADELAAAAADTEMVVSAGLEPIDGGEDDIDFASLVRLRRRHYAAEGQDLELPDPRRALVDIGRARSRQRAFGMRSWVASAFVLVAFISLCVLVVTAFTGFVIVAAPAGAATILAVALFAIITPEDPHPPMVVMPAEVAGPWGDFMAAAEYVASGRAAVTTAQALGAAEPRARSALSLLLEDHRARAVMDADSVPPGLLDDEDRAELRDESRKLCACIWALNRIETLGEDQLQQAADESSPPGGS
ncbi:hypothetical protein ASG90_03715 [Nocardioides sp. Soil797]|nr:hypothetical protein ASG90_03715 [Nocardioides sp. Soil797]